MVLVCASLISSTTTTFLTSSSSSSSKRTSTTFFCSFLARTTLLGLVGACECELQVCSPLQGFIRPRWAAQFVQFFFSFFLKLRLLFPLFNCCGKPSTELSPFTLGPENIA